MKGGREGGREGGRVRFVESAVTSRIICTVRRWATLKEGRKGGREGGRERT
jgi:hypothetical protein